MKLIYTWVVSGIGLVVMSCVAYLLMLFCAAALARRAARRSALQSGPAAGEKALPEHRCQDADRERKDHAEQVTSQS